MRDIEFYAQILGLCDPFYVDEVELSISNADFRTTGSAQAW